MKRVLIVPYGIETIALRLCLTFLLVLIVPYGIETQQSGSRRRACHRVNCTLWN